jgi:SAM-dependent methyltransferase
MKTTDEIIASYDTLASEYAVSFCDELEGKPFDRSLLQRFANTIPGDPLCDLGCGPGHVAAYLGSVGVDVIGVDLSPGMIAEAKRRYPSIDFQVGDMLDLKMGTGSLGGIVAFYSIIHLRREILQEAFREMHRVLRPGRFVLTSFHQGQGDLHEDEVLNMPVSFDCTLFEPNEVAHAMEEAGFYVAETTIRRPYEIEYPTQRVYILADKYNKTKNTGF